MNDKPPGGTFIHVPWPEIDAASIEGRMEEVARWFDSELEAGFLPDRASRWALFFVEQRDLVRAHQALAHVTDPDEGSAILSLLISAEDEATAPDASPRESAAVSENSRDADGDEPDLLLDPPLPNPEEVSRDAIVIALFLRFFGGRRDIYARQWHDTRRKRGGYRPVREPLTDVVVAAHLEAHVTLGQYLLFSDDTVSFAVFDLDLAPDALARWRTECADVSAAGHPTLKRYARTLTEAAARIGLPLFGEDSGGKGLHLWMFFEPRIPARAARAALSQVLLGAGLHAAGEVVAEIRLDDVRQIVVVGNITVTPAALDRLVERAIDTVLLTASGRYRARIGAGLSGHVQLRMAQYKLSSDDGAVRRLATNIVAAKIDNQRTLLQRFLRRYGEPSKLAKAIVAMNAVRIRLGKCTSIDEVRGCEGAAANAYFKAFGNMIRNPAFEFDGRNRRPPVDPINALLSLGYTFLANAVHGILEVVGLDPYVGALHALESNRPSLVCDLMEEFRAPVVDALVVAAVNRGVFGQDDFECVGPGEPVVVKRGTLGTWARAIEQRLSSDTLVYPPAGVRLSFRQIESDNLGRASFLRLRSRLEGIIDPKTDSLRYYPLCRACAERVEAFGRGPGILKDPPEVEVI
jgi:CRISPR-associated protein Cas1